VKKLWGGIKVLKFQNLTCCSHISIYSTKITKRPVEMLTITTHRDIGFHQRRYRWGESILIAVVVRKEEAIITGRF